MTKQIDFSRWTSIKIGPISKVKVLDKIDKNNNKYFIVGGGSNLLLSPTPPPLAILGDEFDYINKLGNKLFVGCKTKGSKLFSYCKKNNITNFEFLSQLPGTIGGIVKMNAGLKEDEIGNMIHSIKTHKGYITKQEINFGYRTTNIDDIIYEVVFDIQYGFDKEQVKYFKNLRANQPKLPSAGSCFKNPPNNFAGKLIEDVGLKGYKIGNMGFSDKHANFLLNYGNGVFEDAISLIKLAKEKVLDSFGILLEEEIKIIGE